MKHVYAAPRSVVFDSNYFHLSGNYDKSDTLHLKIKPTGRRLINIRVKGGMNGGPRVNARVTLGNLSYTGMIGVGSSSPTVLSTTSQ